MSKKHKLSGVNYRKIWESAYGPIPKGFHIHHIDGNPYNNDLSNLTCITAEEHSAIHNNEALKWAQQGGKIGGDKCRDEKIGFFAASIEQKKQWAIYASSFVNREQHGEKLKEGYKKGTIKHWTTFYTKEEASAKISAGDPGKSRRGKEGWNKGKKMTLKNPELSRQIKSNAALKRQKYTCECCGKDFDGGNLKRHQNAQEKNKIS